MKPSSRCYFSLFFWSIVVGINVPSWHFTEVSVLQSFFPPLICAPRWLKFLQVIYFYCLLDINFLFCCFYPSLCVERKCLNLILRCSVWGSLTDLLKCNRLVEGHLLQHLFNSGWSRSAHPQGTYDVRGQHSQPLLCDRNRCASAASALADHKPLLLSYFIPYDLGGHLNNSFLLTIFGKIRWKLVCRDEQLCADMNSLKSLRDLTLLLHVSPQITWCGHGRHCLGHTGEFVGQIIRSVLARSCFGQQVLFQCCSERVG